MVTVNQRPSDKYWLAWCLTCNAEAVTETKAEAQTWARNHEQTCK